jgi:hypothetical protein
MDNETVSRVLEFTRAFGWQVAGLVTLLTMVGYAVYMRYLHPLAKYPGPFLASLTHLWKLYEMYNGQMEYTVRRLHDRYGAIVRIGPNDLVISSPDAVKAIYLSGSAFQKVPPDIPLADADEVLQRFYVISPECFRDPG